MGENLVKSIEQIHLEAVAFVSQKFPDLKPNEERITILSIMKMLTELEALRVQSGE